MVLLWSASPPSLPPGRLRHCPGPVGSPRTALKWFGGFLGPISPLGPKHAAPGRSLEGEKRVICAPARPWEPATAPRRPPLRQISPILLLSLTDRLSENGPKSHLIYRGPYFPSGDCFATICARVRDGRLRPRRRQIARTRCRVDRRWQLPPKRRNQAKSRGFSVTCARPSEGPNRWQVF